MKIDFNQIIEKFNQLDSKVRYAIFAGILLAIFLFDFFTIMGFQWSLLQKIDNENQTLSQDIERLKVDLQRIDKIKLGLQNYRSQLEAMNMKIRPVEDVSSILEDISHLANETNVKIDQLTPQIEAQQTLITTDVLKYTALPIVIQASSEYHVLGHFINKLESTKLFFTLGSLVIESRPTDIHHQSINAVLKVVLSDKNIVKNTTGDQKK